MSISILVSHLKVSWLWVNKFWWELHIFLLCLMYDMLLNTRYLVIYWLELDHYQERYRMEQRKYCTTVGGAVGQNQSPLTPRKHMRQSICLPPSSPQHYRNKRLALPSFWRDIRPCIDTDGVYTTSYSYWEEPRHQKRPVAYIIYFSNTGGHQDHPMSRNIRNNMTTAISIVTDDMIGGVPHQQNVLGLDLVL